jgi:tRNA pseudouridine38-40 synthase
MVHRAWHWHQQLNIEKMNEAASLLLTYTNFESFSKVHTQVDNFNCDVSKAVWKQEGSQYKFYISANRFLRNMVRAIVGTTVEVGNSKLDVDGFKEIIEQRDRRKAGESVPAQGLYLTEVIYPDGLLTSLQSL